MIRRGGIITLSHNMSDVSQQMSVLEERRIASLDVKERTMSPPNTFYET